VESIPLLAHHFLEKASAKLNKKIVGIEERAIKAMMQYPWSGNIREMQNIIERAAVLTNDMIRLENLPLIFAENYTKGAVDTVDTKVSFQAERERHLARVEKGLLERYLVEAGGNVSKAAQLANIPRRTFYRILDRHGLKGRAVKSRPSGEAG
jgi:DNA-binding NtrC family response regulator